MKITHRLATIISTAALAVVCVAFIVGCSTPSGSAPTAHVRNSYKFVFGGKPKSGWTQITPANLYSTNSGYGFEPGTLPVAVGGDGLGADKPFYFSVAEPEGNYKVTVTFGSKAP